MKPELDRRWRLVLGTHEEGDPPLTEMDERRLQVTRDLYDQPKGGSLEQAGGLARWFAQVNEWFPPSFAKVLQHDAAKKVGVKALLASDVAANAVQPDIDLGVLLMRVHGSLPQSMQHRARGIMERLIAELRTELSKYLEAEPAMGRERGELTRRPKQAEIDLRRSVLSNLRKHPSRDPFVVDHVLGHRRRRPDLNHLTLLIDQSGSMMTSFLFASLYAAILGSVTALNLRMIAFDTRAVDLTELLDDPVDVLFNLQLGGGTDIGSAVEFALTDVTDPAKSTFVLISDLYEGGDEKLLMQQVQSAVSMGINVIALTAITHKGEPDYSEEVAKMMAELGIPVLSCSPDRFPRIIAQALARLPISI
jgi:uncharacterized protein with von Willebrand factor type A (vWA) domain